MRCMMEYASPASAFNLATTHLNILQTMQKKALKIITSCTAASITDHIHQEIKLLKIKNFLNLKVIQFIATATTNQLHPRNYMANLPITPKIIKTTLYSLYHSQILSSLIPSLPQTSCPKHFLSFFF